MVVVVWSYSTSTSIHPLGGSPLPLAAYLPLAPLPTAPVFTVPPDEKCRAAARPGSVIKRPGSGDEMFGRGETGPYGPLVTKARNRRSALGGTWEHQVTLSSDLGGPRRRRQRQTGTPRQALQSHLAAGLDMGHDGVAEGCVDAKPVQARCCCRRRWLASRWASASSSWPREFRD